MLRPVPLELHCSQWDAIGQPGAFLCPPIPMNEGFFFVSRSLVDPHHDLHPHSTGEKACRMGAWIDLIGMARWKPGGGLDRGELKASQSFLASRWNWGKKKVARFLDTLESQDRIQRRHTPGPREPDRISICNYDDYQNVRPANDSTSRTTSDTANRTTSRTANDPEVEEEEKKEEGLSSEPDGSSDAKALSRSNGRGGQVKPNELVAWWVEEQAVDPSKRDRGKQAAAAKRVCDAYKREEIAAAVHGIELLYPFSDGRPWDLMDLEKHFLRAAKKALTDHPKVKDHRRRAEMLKALEGR